MADQFGTASLSSRGEMVTVFTKNAVTDPVIAYGTPTISIDFSPHGAAYSYTYNAVVYNPANTFRASIAGPITFTATASGFDWTQLQQGVVSPTATAVAVALGAVEFFWDFGDGTQALGQVVTHTYKAVAPDIQVSLRVTDAYGRAYYARKQMYLTA